MGGALRRPRLPVHQRGSERSVRDFALSKVYRLLEPGPVVLLTTSSRGKANVMTLSWHMMLDFEPPLIGCVVSENNFSYLALKATKECGLAIPTLDLARQVVGVGNCSGRNTDKFARFGLSPIPAKTIEAPLIRECFANLECTVTDILRKYEIFVLRVAQAWIEPRRKERRTLHHCGYGAFVADGKAIKLRSRMR